MNMIEVKNYQRPLIVAARDTLMNIAGVCGVSALSLTADRSLAGHLGYRHAEFLALAKYQCRVGNRLRRDGLNTMIDSLELHPLQVWQVYSLTVLRAIGTTFDQGDAKTLIALGSDELQAGSQ